MKQNEQTGFTLPDNLESMTADELIALRQQIRRERDQRRVSLNDEITTRQHTLRREGITARRVFDIQMNELRQQLDEIGPRHGQPAYRIVSADLHDKMSTLRHDHALAQLERDTEDQRLATDRLRRTSQLQLAYEQTEQRLCRLIRSKGGFQQYADHSSNNTAADTDRIHFTPDDADRGTNIGGH